MSARAFVDTTVLMYAHDVNAGAKRGLAKHILQELWNQGTGALSMQVLQEFYVNVRRKIAKPLSKASARGIVNSYRVLWCLETTTEEISVAFRIEHDARIGFWDALIVAAALKAGTERILSEDVNAGQTISGVRIENPFAGSS